MLKGYDDLYIERGCSGVFDPVNGNMSLRDRVVQDILQKIEKGDLKPGDRLPPERDMAIQFNVSRTTVRDALRTLAALGVVSIEQGRGIFVRVGEGIALGQALWTPMVMEEQSITNLFEVRKSLETAAAGWAAQRATDVERSELMRIVTSIQQEMTESGESVMDMMVVADQEFHGTILRSSHNPVASRIMFNLLDVLEDARRHSLSISGRAWKSVLEHEIIAKAILRGNVKEAETAMFEHLKGVEEEILKNL